MPAPPSMPGRMRKWRRWEPRICRAARNGSKPSRNASAGDRSRLLPFLIRPWNDLDLEDRGPLLTRHKKAFPRRIVSNAVQHRFLIDHLVRWKQATQINPGDHSAIAGIDARNPVRMPDIGINLSLDKFQLVELVYFRRAVLDHDVMGFLKRKRIAKAKGRRAIAGDDFPCGPRHSPALAAVGELLHRPEAEAVVDKADAGLPGPLINVCPPVDNPLAKILRRQIALLDNSPALRLNGEQGRMSRNPGTFVKKTIEKKEALGIAFCRVRIFRHHLVTQNRSGQGAMGDKTSGKGKHPCPTARKVRRRDHRVYVNRRPWKLPCHFSRVRLWWSNQGSAPKLTQGK